MLNTKNCHIFVAMVFNDKQTIKTVYKDDKLKKIFQKKFDLSEKDALVSVTPDMLSQLNNIFDSIIITTPRLGQIYDEFVLEPNKTVKKPSRTSKVKRLSNKEIIKRSDIRGFQTPNDKSMLEVNNIENLIAKLQRRGRKEYFDDEESNKLSSIVKEFNDSITSLLDNNKKRRKNS